MEQKTNYSIPLAFITILYFMWGFITCLNDILIPHFKAIFVLSYAETMLIQFAFFGAYFIGSLIYFFISLSSGDPINRIGYKNGIILGLFISAVGTSLFYPAAAYQSFGFFLAALFVLALGFTILQIAANPFVILLGKPETGSHRLSLAGAINSFATTIAPIIGGALILGSAVAASDINSVKKPYLAGMVRMAAERATAEDIARLQQRLEEHRSSALDHFLQRDMLFHREIAAITGNPIFSATVEAMFNWASEYYQSIVRAPGAENLTLTEHQAIVDAIAAHDPDRAAQAMHDHLTRANALYRQLVAS